MYYQIRGGHENERKKNSGKRVLPALLWGRNPGDYFFSERVCGSPSYSSKRAAPGAQLRAPHPQFSTVSASVKRIQAEQEEVQMVRRVGRKIAEAAEGFLRDLGRESQIENYEWEYNLIEDDKVVNAWCMPGGKIAVYTGILRFTKDETGLAVVMGHEVAHAIAGHGNERMSQALLANMGGLALSVALSSKPKQTREISMIAFGVGATVGVLLPYSRLHESEADRMGLMFMARAGYDPRAAVPFWERMNEKGGPRPPEFLSTHPAPASRINNLKAYIPEALPYYERSLKGK
jgi:predicted Zn-dependent protease